MCMDPAFFQLFDSLPVSVKVALPNGTQFLCVHGGFPHEDQDREYGMMWNDPTGDYLEWAENPRGGSVLSYGKSITMRGLDEHSMSLLTPP